MMRLILTAALVLLMSHGAVRAQDRAPQAPTTGAPTTSVPGEGEAAPSSENDSEALPMERYGETDKACMRWSDGCRTCGRGADGVVACSNIGIACQPGAVTCAGSQNAPAAK
jgi:hypothetical protein